MRTLRKRLGPRWLVGHDGDDGELLGYVLDVIKDAFLQRIGLGLMARFPQNGPNGETAPPDALALLGRDRRVIRGLFESDASYAARLLKWLDDRRTCGNPFTLMRKLSEYLGPLPSYRTVDARGNWYSRAADGTESALLKQENWNWSGEAIGQSWSRFWVIIYPNGLWSDYPYAWGENGPGWGDGNPETIGSTATQEHVSTVRSIVADWMPAGTRCVNIIVAFDPDSFDPSAPEPDGLWGRGSKTNASGVQVSSRLETARYWDGVGKQVQYPNGVDPAVFVPTDLTGLLIWLRADTGVTLTSGRVSTWADQSGNGNDFVQSTAGNRPIPGTAINGQATVTFDRARPDYVSKGSFSAPSAGEVLIVLKNAGPNGSGDSPWQMTTDPQGSWYTWIDANIYENWGSTSRSTATAPGVGLDSAHVYNVRSAAGAYSVHIDGTQIYSTGTNTVGFDPTLFLGYGPSSSTGYSGDIAEVLIFDRVLSSGERDQVMGYLRDRYNTP